VPTEAGPDEVAASPEQAIDEQAIDEQAIADPEAEAMSVAAEPDEAPSAQPETEPVIDPEPQPEPEQESRPSPDGEMQQEVGPDEAAEEQALPEAWDSVAETPQPRRWPWAVGLVAMLLLAVGQLTFIYRVELAVLSPELRPLLVAACEVTGCSVPWPRRPELVGIESSDLEPAGGDRLLLTAMLKNRAPFVQEYPHLELTLTDTQDDALLRKVLAPSDWLASGQPAATGFAANGELAVKLLLEAKGVPAVGYRLYLFYP
jgi:hypothetical protein